MRHLYGTGLAVIMTAVMFFAGAWGYLRLLKLPVAPAQTAALPGTGGSLLSNGTLVLALAALVATAVLAGLFITVRRVSPLAAGLPGLLLLAWTALYLVSVRSAVRFIPLRTHAFGAGWEALLFNGVLGAAGAVLAFPLFIPSRWRESGAAQHAGREQLSAFEADEYLASVRPDPAPRPREDEYALSGTVLTQPTRPSYPEELSHPVSRPVAPVDTTRVTGASRALRATGSFRATTGSVPRATGSLPRSTGSSGAASDSSLLGRPYYQTPEEWPGGR